ncbi:putative Ig domain-containing protein [Dyella flagellata]|uniref:Hemagglutinin n=1 Tax=Dyella flagellata TaxID=1867833 RepID=A0ABQ5X5I8_9GAMM|nr:putative Ig domain-containing protein [Dyella flagellata]GLQ86469.1 hemagglutinin [Dyella flagellata]
MASALCRLMLVLCLSALSWMPATAHAGNLTGCPSSFEVPAGGSATLDTYQCPFTSGLGTYFPAFYPDSTTTGNDVVNTAHGTATNVSNGDQYLAYQNNGDGATSDTYTWVDANSSTSRHVETISILNISTTSLPNAAVGTAYNQTISGAGGTPSGYSFTSTSLPAGLTLSTGGVLSGTPTTAGSYSFTVTLSDGVVSVPRTYSGFTVANAGISISPSSLPNGTVGAAYNQSVSASGGTSPYSYTISAGALPAGLSISASSGAITGTPTAGGTFSFTVKATDASSNTATQTYSGFTVAAPTISVSPTTVPGATQNSSYNQTITASGGTSTYTYAVTAGSLPSGLSISSSGVLSGTPSVYGNYNFTITATDSSTGTGPYTGSRAYSLSVTASTPTITTASVANGTVGVSYSQTISASSGNAPYTFSILAGSLPTGLSISSGGVISGTPTAGGSYNFTVKVTDAASNTASRTYNGVTINAPIITVSPSTLPGATQNSSYSQTVTATGGTSPYTYAVTSGTLPSGLTLNANTGAVSGTPTVYGNYSFTITATDSSGGTGPYSGSANYTLAVTASTPIITTASVANGTVGVSYSQTISASSGNAPYTFSISAGSLPSGLSISSGGVISGTPTAGGSYTFTVKVTDAASNTATRTYTSVTIGAPIITVSPSTLPGATQNSSYSQTVTATGGTSPYTYAVTSGTLPSGLTINPNTGTLTGTPTVYGNYSFTITATDSSTGTGPYTGSRAYTLAVTASIPVITTASVANGTVGVSYSQTISASNGNAPYTYSISAGSLPPGLSISSGGLISGTPTAGGSYNFTVKVTDAASNTATQSYTGVAISAAIITVSPSTLPNATQNSSYSQTVTATGGTSPYTYAVTSGTLPTGLTLNANTGTLSGTATVFGNYSFTITATDSSGGTGPYTGSRAYTLPVTASNPVISPTTLPNGTVGTSYSQTISASNGNAPYTFSLNAGSLPPGVTLSSNGTLAGTPTAGGSYTFTVKVTDAASNTATQTYTGVTINAPTLSLSPASITAATVGAAYSQSFSASGGTAPYTYAQSGSLPAGMGWNASTATLSGTPTQAGSFPIVVQVTDSSGGAGPYTHNFNYTVQVNAASLSITPANNSAFTATYATAYSQSFSGAGGTSPYSFRVSSGSLPAGLSLSSSGVLSGTSTQTGHFSFAVTMTDSSTGTGAPFSTTANYSLTVNASTITLTPATLTSGMVSTSYSAQLSARGGIGPYSFSVTSGALPAGLSLSSSGALTGTPTAAGAFNITVTATDANSFTGSQAYTLTIGAPTVSLNPTSSTLPTATAESAYTQSFTASGGTAPYHYAVSTGSLPAGLSLSNTGALSGTPTVAGAYTFSVTATDSSTGTGAPFTATRSYTLNINAPSLAIAPTTLPNPQQAVAYSQQISASGGAGGYTYTITQGALPAGLTLSNAGMLSGTPTANGTFSFTVTAKDGNNFTASQSYTVNVRQAVPIAGNDTASTPANQAVTIAVTSVDTGGPVSSIAIAGTPSHGTANVSGLTIVYTPNSNFFGTDTLTYTASGPGGTSAAATVTITVTPLAVPTAPAQSVTTLNNQPLTIDATQGATGAPYTAVTIVQQPSTGQAVVSGTHIVFTPTAGASGKASLIYTLANPFGVSSPITVTINTNPIPVAIAQTAAMVAGRTLQVNLTQGAQGGPFNGASLVSLSPASAGTASIQAASGGYQLTFTGTPTFSGTAVVTFTLSNAYAVSAPAMVTIAVSARPDPSKDPTVTGMLAAQVDATRSFALGQIDNFQQRLEVLHNGGGEGFQNGLSFSSDSMQFQQQMRQLKNMPADLNRRYWADPQQPTASTSSTTSGLPDGYGLWTGGAINFGSRSSSQSMSGFGFNTSGVSGGIDKRITSSLAVGGGIGYGHNDTVIGHGDARNDSNSYSLVMYASYNPGAATFVDGVLGYQWLSFDTQRQITADGNTVAGRRDGTQWFGSFSAGYLWNHDAWRLSPYGRIDLAHGQLNSYTEHGDAIYALHYQNQTVSTSTSSIGLLSGYTFKRDDSVVMPQLRVEFGHDFQSASEATMSYADLLSGPYYRAAVDRLARNHYLIGFGVNWQYRGGAMIRLEYDDQIDGSNQNNQTIMFGVQMPLH